METLIKILVLSALLMLFCINSLLPQVPIRTDTTYRIRKDIYHEYKHNARQLLKKHNDISFVMRHRHVSDYNCSDYINHVYLYTHNSSPVLATENRNSSMCMTTREITYISHSNQDIFTIKRRIGGQYNSIGMLDFVNSVFDEMPYYVMATGNNGLFLSGMNFIDKFDTIINGVYHKVYVALRMSYQSNPTRGADTKLLTVIKSFFNNETGFIDSVSSIGINHSQKTYVSINDIRFVNMSTHYDSLFDTGSAQYKNYSKYSSVHPVYMLHSENSDRITNNLLNHPLVSPFGDTTSIKEHEGYILLDFWTFNCAPCLRHFERYMTEKEKLGSLEIERHGIKVMAINYKSNNLEMIKETGNKYGINEILFSGKGMDSVIQFPYQGNFILLSPDKEIIYENPVLEDYNVLVESKIKNEENKK